MNAQHLALALDGYPLNSAAVSFAAHEEMDVEPDPAEQDPAPDSKAAAWIIQAMSTLPDDCSGSNRDCDIEYVRTVVLPRALAELPNLPMTLDQCMDRISALYLEIAGLYRRAAMVAPSAVYRPHLHRAAAAAEADANQQSAFRTHGGSRYNEKPF